MRLRALVALIGTGLTGAAVAMPVVADAAKGVTTTNGCVTSVPDPGSTTPVKICYTLFQPPHASRSHKVPLVFHSHGWGGSRTTDATSSEVKPYLDADYGVLSFDQRGFGESNGGKAYVENPNVEGRDVEKLVSLVSHLGWVIQDGPGDPRIGAVGGSYGGGYQFVGAFREIANKHKQVFDALAPQITWYDLKHSLAPQGVAKTEWSTALTAAGANSLPQEVLEGFAESAATGTWSDGSIPGTVNLDAFFAKNGPKWQVSQGRHIDVPVLFGQGITDELFPLDQGLKNWANALTPRARKQSIFVGYNGGHVLPNAFPLTVQPSGDPCSKKLTQGKDFAALTVMFFNRYLKHQAVRLPGLDKFHLATASGTCTTTSSVTPNTTVAAGTVATPEFAGPPLATKIADGPIRVADEQAEGVLLEGERHLRRIELTQARGARVVGEIAVGPGIRSRDVTQCGIPAHLRVVVLGRPEIVGDRRDRDLGRLEALHRIRDDAFRASGQIGRPAPIGADMQLVAHRDVVDGIVVPVGRASPRRL